MKSPASFIAITSEGGLLPADFLHELPDPKTTIDGVTPVAYHLAEGERLNEQINRSWNRLKGCWENFKKAIAAKPAGDPTTTDTRERWLFPLFQELGFGRLTAAKPIEVDGHSYPVSHGWNQVPIHLVGSHADHRPSPAGHHHHHRPGTLLLLLYLGGLGYPSRRMPIPANLSATNPVIFVHPDAAEKAVAITPCGH